MPPDRLPQPDSMPVHFHKRGGGALCGSVGGEGSYDGEGVNCTKCKRIMVIDEEEIRPQIDAEPKRAKREAEEREQPES
jgi:hypothetical protein